MQNWYALHSRPLCEQSVQNSLLKKEFDAYAPMIKNVGDGKSFKRAMYVPLFPSLVLVKAASDAIEVLLRTPGVVGFYYWHNQPAIINETDVAQIRKFIKQYKTVQKQKIPLDSDLHQQCQNTVSIAEFTWTVISDGNVKLFLPSLGYCLVASVEEVEYSQPVKQSPWAFGKWAWG